MKKCKGLMYATRQTLMKKWGPSTVNTKWLWEGIIRPQLTYGCIIWGMSAQSNYWISKLGLLQRLAMLQMGHVRKSTPTATMEIMYGIPPLHLEIKRLAIMGCFRIKQEIDIPRVRQRCKNGHISEISKVLETGELQTELDYHKGYKNWKRFSVTIEDGTPGNDYEADWICYMDGSKINNRTGIGAVLYHQGEEFLTISANVGTSTVFQAELTAISVALREVNKWIKEWESVYLYVDSQAAIKAIMKLEVQTITQEKVVQEMGKINNIRTFWIKAHAGHKGNEEADAAAERSCKQ